MPHFFSTHLPLPRQIAFYLAVAILGVVAGYGIGYAHAKFTGQEKEILNATAKLWIYHLALETNDKFDPSSARRTIAMQADEAVVLIAETDRKIGNSEQRQFQERLLREYAVFRAAHPELYKFPPQIGEDKRNEWEKTDKFIADFLAEHTKNQNGSQ